MLYKAIKSKACGLAGSFKIGETIWNELGGVLGIDGRAIYVDINNAYKAAAKYKGCRGICRDCAAEVQEEK